MDGFLVETQNQGRAEITWEPSHEWRLAEATLSSRGFQWFTRKPLGSLVDPQSQYQRTKDGDEKLQTGLTGGFDRSERWVPVRPVRSTGQTGVRRRSPETLKWKTRVGVARFESRLSKLRRPSIRPIER
jgi:hypothetical protein